jgi:hypothetical protein
MNLDQQVCSLDLAKRLKELGVKQDGLFSWQFGLNDDEYKGTWYIVDEGQKYFGNQEGYAAFTVAELGEMLWMAFEKADWDLLYKAYGEVFGFKGTQHIGELGIVNLMRRPDMAAKMLIYLLENKLLAA